MVLNKTAVNQNIAILRVYASKVHMPRYGRQKVIGLPGEKIIYFYNWGLQYFAYKN